MPPRVVASEAFRIAPFENKLNGITSVDWVEIVGLVDEKHSPVVA
jgi:hypothetical protein